MVGYIRTHTFRNAIGCIRVYDGGFATAVFAGVRPDWLIITAAYEKLQLVVRIPYNYNPVRVEEITAFCEWPEHARAEIQRAVDITHLRTQIVKRRKHGQMKSKRR